ncbi:hypothetical protein CLU79DRAFT_575258 [Phycomyces nitens]|nr:hypothetical protein CLU79DRAFT_575258 [Phycomyces nitens]
MMYIPKHLQLKSNINPRLLLCTTAQWTPTVMRDDSDQDQSKKYMCSECSEEFDIKFSYQRHMETHSVDRPKFGCHICLKLYTTKFNRDRHIKLHK